MKLKKWIEDQGLSTREFAEMVFVTKNYMSAIANGRRKPSKRLAKSIEDVTNGKVRMPK